MSDVNFINIGGRLGRDAELRYLPSGMAVCKFSIASNKWNAKEKKETATWVDVQVWGKTAEHYAPKLKKGSKVIAFGELEIRSAQKDGVTRYYTSVNASKLYVVEANDPNGSPKHNVTPVENKEPKRELAEAFSETGVETDMPGFIAEDLPF